MSDSNAKSFSDVEFGEDLPELSPDVSLANVTLFAE